MPHFIEMKKKLWQDIISVLDKSEALDLDKTIAEFSLRTGFTDKTIKHVLHQMNELGYITIDGNVIKRPEQHA